MNESIEKQTYKVEADIGCTNEKAFQFTDADTGAAIDLTGYTAKMEIRANVNSETVLYTLTTENGGIVIETATGRVTYVLALAGTVKPMVCYGDLKMTADAKPSIWHIVEWHFRKPFTRS